MSNKRRIPQNIIKPVGCFPGQCFHQASPIGAQGISMRNFSRFFQRQAHKVFAKFRGNLHIHLVVGKPQGNLGYLRREVLVFNAVKRSTSKAAVAKYPKPFVRAADFQYPVRAGAFAVGDSEIRSHRPGQKRSEAIFLWNAFSFRCWFWAQILPECSRKAVL